VFGSFLSWMQEKSKAVFVVAMTNTVPLANLMDGQIAALRHWARGRAREATARSTPARNGRRLATFSTGAVPDV
jgi:hypothetical protein